MNKDEQIKFLEDSLTQDIRAYLENEVIYRGLRQMVLASSHDKDILAAETKAKRNKDNLIVKIAKSRELIKEIKNGEFTV